MWQPQGFYNQYVLRAPVILTGIESVRGLYNYPAARIAVIHGKSFKDHELFARTFNKKSVRFMERSWMGEPDFVGLSDTVRQLEEYRPEAIIAVGGGSVVDGSKLCRLLYEFPCFDPKERRITGDLFRTKFIAIPTTVGSGAEVSSAAVFVDHESRCKDMIVMHELQPEVVVYDKRYVEGTPHRLLAASAMDAMAHILEGYVSNRDNSFIEIIAEKGLSILHAELTALMNIETSVDCERLQYAGYIGGMVQNHCIVGAAHAVAHQLTDYGYAHSETVGLLLPAVTSLNEENEVVAAKYAKISREASFSNYNELETFIRNVADIVGTDETRTRLKNLLVMLLKDKDFCKKVRDDRGGQGNPVSITDEYLEKLAERI